ncbi:hypothetical protein ACMAZE_03695 [Pseudopelagicola sp. nBUS_20]|uniref:hypothetical protein n=1 Tax=Pseudopelagicola sp. nBUS_20 TaxID=3395317 RepID=UPI003EBCD44B
MPGPVTNNEIEDVLTSIRRLVSDNRKDSVKSSHEPSEMDAQAVARSHAKGTKAASALVLTPSLRVEKPTGNVSVDHSPEVEAESDENFVERKVHDETDYDVEFLDVPERGDTEVQKEEIVEQETLVDEVLVLETLKGQDETHAGAIDIELYDNPPAEDLVVSSVEHFDSPEELPAEQPFDFQKVLDARIAQWRDVQPSGSFEEPDAPGDSDYAGTETDASAWEAEPPLEQDEALNLSDFKLETGENHLLAQREGATVEPRGLVAPTDEATIIDESMLREMVADIVRQELQGALGERITRNVRKLVRREINRALAAHELD